MNGTDNNGRNSNRVESNTFQSGTSSDAKALNEINKLNKAFSPPPKASSKDNASDIDSIYRLNSLNTDTSNPENCSELSEKVIKSDTDNDVNNRSELTRSASYEGSPSAAIVREKCDTPPYLCEYSDTNNDNVDDDSIDRVCDRFKKISIGPYVKLIQENNVDDNESKLPDEDNGNENGAGSINNDSNQIKRISKIKCAVITLASGLGSFLAGLGSIANYPQLIYNSARRMKLSKPFEPAKNQADSVAELSMKDKAKKSLSIISSAMGRRLSIPIETAQYTAGSVAKLGMEHMTKNTNFPKMIRYKIDFRKLDSKKDGEKLQLKAGDIIYHPPILANCHPAGHMEIVLTTQNINNQQKGGSSFTRAHVVKDGLQVSPYDSPQTLYEKNKNKKMFIYRFKDEEQRNTFWKAAANTTFNKDYDAVNDINSGTLKLDDYHNFAPTEKRKDIKFRISSLFKPSSLFQIPNYSKNNDTEETLDKSFCSQYIAFAFKKAFEGCLPGPSAGWTPTRLHAAFSVHSNEKYDYGGFADDANR
ncbi:MAG: hypothetical protein GY874_18960 [Desulfobacteraceae bacterium]|nr:hypothetical protein [Desulfobacteraceae bacterium]